jgi:hypothetical protein
MAIATLQTAIVSASVPIETRDELERLAREADRTLSAEIRRALVAHVAELKRHNEEGAA